MSRRHRIYLISRTPLLWGAMGAMLLTVSCGHAPVVGVPVPSVERLIEAPPSAERVESVGLKHLLRGLFFLHSGEAAAAVPHLRLALLYSPDSGFVHERLSRAWGLAGNTQKARAVLSAGLVKSPDDPWLSWLAGELAAEDGERRLAIEHLRRAVANPEVLPLAAETMVDTLQWLGEDNEARELAGRALEVRADADLAVRLGSVFEDHGNLDTANDIYRQARVFNPTSKVAALAEARILGLQQRPGDAADALVSVLGYYPDDWDLYIRIVRYLLRAGRDDFEAYRTEALTHTQGSALGRMAVAAADIFEGRSAVGLALLRQTIAETDVLDVRLFHAEVLHRLGDGRGCLQTLWVPSLQRDARLSRVRAWCYAVGDQLDLAMEQITWAVLDGGEPREALVDAAIFLGHRASEEVAAEYLAALIRRVHERVIPEDIAIARSQLADLFGHGKEAIAQLERLDSGSTDVQLRLADLWSRYGRFDEAVDLLERMLRQEPADAMRLNALGFVLTDAGVRLDDAEVYLRRAHRLAPDDGYIADSLGWLLYRRGQYDAALAVLVQASRSVLGDPVILRHLGDAYRAVGNPDAARAADEAATEAKPSMPLRRLFENDLSKDDAT